MEGESMIPTVKWTKKGFAAEHPRRAEPMNEDSQMEVESDGEEVDELAGYETEESRITRDMPTFVSETNRKAVKFADEYPMAVEDSSDDEESYAIKPSDCVLLAAKIEQEGSSLEVYVYEEAKFNLYVHHELILNAFPVGLEWLCCDFGSAEGDAFQKGNFGIVGLMNGAIELWDLDQLDSVEPQMTVGGKEAHTDSVTNLSLHPIRPNILVSASADSTVKFWDLQNNKLLSSQKGFGEEIQNVMWDPNNEALLYAYGPSNILRIIDARGPKEVGKLKANFGIENFAVSPLSPNKLFVSSETGAIKAVDLGTLKFINDFEVQAHKEAATSLVCNNSGHMVSTGLDGTAHVWDVKTLKLMASQKTDCGRLFGSSIHSDSDFLFACGSSAGEVVIWDFKESVN